MKMRGRKATCFWFINFILTVIFFSTLFKRPEILNFFAIITGYITNAIVFIGGNTYDKWIRSKHFKKGFNDEEN
jgi:hypothetical protein